MSCPSLPEARWAVLMGQVLTLARSLPVRPTRMRRRRIGDPAPSPVVAAPPPWSDAAVAHVIGTLSRCCSFHSFMEQPAAVEREDILEARLMVAAVDRLLGVEQAWEGREMWRRHPLEARLGIGPAIDDKVRLQLHLRLAAGEERFSLVVDALSGIGLRQALFPCGDSGRIAALSPVRPILSPPLSLPPPPIETASRQVSPRRLRHWHVIGGMVAVGLVLQSYLWLEMTERLRFILE